jgi:peptidyl-prolyl cis-trans isomerase B (cyclophilin B)
MMRDGMRIRVTAVAAILLSIVMAFALAGCGESGSAADENSGAANESSENSGNSGNDTEDTEVADTKPVIEITMQDGGKIDVELDPAIAPVTVENFLKLVNDGF